MEELSKNIVQNILSVFRQMIEAEYQLNLFKLHLELDNFQAIESVDSEFKEFADIFAQNQECLRSSERLSFLSYLENNVSQYKSELFSLINAVHKSQLIYQVYGEYYPVLLNYHDIKTKCFEKVKYFSSKYQNGYIDPYYSKKMATFGKKYQQANLHFDPTYYYLELHNYFNQVESHQIKFEKLEKDSCNQFSFKYLFFPMFINKRDRSKNYSESINAVIDGYFEGAAKSLISSHRAIVNKSKNNKQTLNTNQGRRLRKALFDSAFIYKNYPEINLSENSYSEEDKTILFDKLFSDYNDESHSFVDENLLHNIKRTQNAYSMFMHPVQFVFSTRHAQKLNTKKNHVFLFFGDNVLWRYLESDRTGYWLNQFLLIYLQVNLACGDLKERTKCQELMDLLLYISPEMKFTQLLYFLATQNFLHHYKEKQIPLKNRDFSEVEHIFPYLTQQFYHDYVLKHYAKDKTHVENTVLDNLAKIYNIETNVPVLNNKIVRDKLKNADVKIDTFSLKRLLESLLNNKYKSIEQQESISSIGASGLTYISSYAFNPIEHVWISHLYKNFLSSIEYLLEKRMKLDYLVGVLMQTETGSNFYDLSQLDSRDTKELKPIIVFSLQLNGHFLNETINELVFDSEKSCSSLSLRADLFLYNPFTEVEVLSRRFNLVDKESDIKYEIELTDDYFRILQGWSYVREPLELSINDYSLVKKIQNCFSSKVLNHERLQNKYILNQEIDIMLSINV